MKIFRSRYKKNLNPTERSRFDIWEEVANIITPFLAVVYLVSMFVIPIYCEKNWTDIQNVWMDWQGLNIGALAYVSTFFLYKAAKHKEKMERRRNFKAEKAFLPNALSELTKYLEENSEYLKNCLNAVTSTSQDMKPKISVSLPSPPIKHEDFFRRCIVTASDDVADYLSGILMRLQIFTSRMK